MPKSRSRKNRPPETALITASDVASWSYCPESWRLEQLQGYEAGNKAMRRAGELRHTRWHATFGISRLMIWLGLLLLAAAIVMWLGGGG